MGVIHAVPPSPQTEGALLPTLVTLNWFLLFPVCLTPTTAPCPPPPEVTSQMDPLHSHLKPVCTGSRLRHWQTTALSTEKPGGHISRRHAGWITVHAGFSESLNRTSAPTLKPE